MVRLLVQYLAFYKNENKHKRINYNLPKKVQKICQIVPQRWPKTFTRFERDKIAPNLVTLPWKPLIIDLISTLRILIWLKPSHVNNAFIWQLLTSNYGVIVSITISNDVRWNYFCAPICNKNASARFPWYQNRTTEILSLYFSTFSS